MTRLSKQYEKEKISLADYIDELTNPAGATRHIHENEMKNQDKLFKAIEKISGQHIVCFHEEAKNYAFKTFQGEWKIIDKNLVHDFADINN